MKPLCVTRQLKSGPKTYVYDRERETAAARCRRLLKKGGNVVRVTGNRWLASDGTLFNDVTVRTLISGGRTRFEGAALVWNPRR